MKQILENKLKTDILSKVLFFALFMHHHLKSFMPLDQGIPS